MRAVTIAVFCMGCIEPFPAFEPADMRPDARSDATSVDAAVQALDGAAQPIDMALDPRDMTLEPSLDGAIADAAPDADDMAFPPLPVLYPLISEWGLSNGGELLDEDGDMAPWIELYNPFDVPLQLADFGLGLGADGDAWMLPADELAPLSFRVIFVSGKNRRGAQWHTDFRVDGRMQNFLRLTASDGRTIFSSTIPQLEAGETFGYPSMPVTTSQTTLRYDTRIDFDADWIRPAFDVDDWPSAPQPLGADLMDAAPVLGRDFDALTADWRFDAPADPEVVERTGQHPGLLRNSAQAPREGISQSGALSNMETGWMSAGNPGGFDFDAAFTWSFWFRGADSDGILIGRSPANSRWNRGSKAIFVRRGRLQWDTGWVGNPSTNLTVNDDVWRHVAITFEPNGDRLRIFVDGNSAYDGQHDVNRFNESASDQGGNADSALFLGGGADSIVGNYNGYIDAVSIWNRVLDAQAIAALAAGALPGPLPRYGDRLATALPGGTPGARVRLHIPPHQMIGLRLSGFAEGFAELWSDAAPLGRLEPEGSLALHRETRVVAAQVTQADGAWIIGMRVEGMRPEPAPLARPTPGEFNAPAR